MIQKVIVTPQVNPAVSSQKEVNFTGANVAKDNQEDNSTLLYSSLAALGAFGLGMLVRKPQAAKKAVSEAVENTAIKAEGAVNDVVGNVTHKPKVKRTIRQNQNIAGKERHMNKTDAKYHRKREKIEVRRQQQREINEQFTDKELAMHTMENGYIAPTRQQQKDLRKLEDQNASERQQKNTIGQNARIENTRTQNKPIKSRKTINPISEELKSLDGTIKALRQRISGAKRFGKDTSKYEIQLNKLIEKRNSILNNAAKAA